MNYNPIGCFAVVQIRMGDITQSFNMVSHAQATFWFYMTTNQTIHMCNYTWASAEQHNEEYNGLAIIAHILTCLKSCNNVKLSIGILVYKQMKIVVLQVLWSFRCTQGQGNWYWSKVPYFQSNIYTCTCLDAHTTSRNTTYLMVYLIIWTRHGKISILTGVVFGKAITNHS